MGDRRVARAMAAEAIAADVPLRWFETLYAAAEAGGATVPWADLAVNPHLMSWPMPNVAGTRTLVVGCGYGDDAEWLASLGCDVTAFDISRTAVRRCTERFPKSRVSYEVADLLDPPRMWLRDRFDVVVEINTIQALPPRSRERAQAIRTLAELTGGILLVVARGRTDAEGSMPWPLLRTELAPLTDLGLSEATFEEFLDAESPPVRRFRGTYTRDRLAAG